MDRVVELNGAVISIIARTFREAARVAVDHSLAGNRRYPICERIGPFRVPLSSDIWLVGVTSSRQLGLAVVIVERTGQNLLEEVLPYRVDPDLEVADMPPPLEHAGVVEALGKPSC